MNHLETYQMARTANVDGASALLRFATSSRPKLINYISTLGVFGTHDSEDIRVVDEYTPIDYEQHHHSAGYVASKWVSEKIFMLASERGIPCNIFRLGLVWADTAEGRFDELQYTYRLIKSCILSGYGIKGYQFEMSPTPVDYVSRAVVFLGTRHLNGGGVYHISSSTRGINGIFEQCNEVLPDPLELVSFYEWICKVKELHHQNRSLPLVPLVAYAFSMNEDRFYETLRNRAITRLRFDCARTHRELEQAGIIAPELDDRVLRVCIERMLSTDTDLRKFLDDAEVARTQSGPSGLAHWSHLDSHREHGEL